MRSTEDPLLNLFIAGAMMLACIFDAAKFAIFASAIHRHFVPAGTTADEYLIAAEFLGSLVLSITLILKYSTGECH